MNETIEVNDFVFVYSGDNTRYIAKVVAVLSDHSWIVDVRTAYWIVETERNRVQKIIPGDTQ